MLPKQFLVDDLTVELAHTLAQLQTLRRRMDATERTIVAQRKRIDALRKRVERSAEKRRKQQHHSEQGTQEPLNH